MTKTNKSPLKSAFKTAKHGNKHVRHGELVRTSSGHTYPAKAINQYHKQNPRTKKGFRQCNGQNRTVFDCSTSVTRDPDDTKTSWQQRDERLNAMTEATEGIDYVPRPPGDISRKQQLDIYEKNTPKIKIWGDDDDDEQSKEEVQGIIEDLKKQLNEQMNEYEKKDLKERIAEYEDQLINMGGAKKNRKTKSKRKANRKTKSKRKAKRNTKKKTKRKAKGNTKKRR